MIDRVSGRGSREGTRAPGSGRTRGARRAWMHGEREWGRPHGHAACAAPKAEPGPGAARGNSQARSADAPPAERFGFRHPDLIPRAASLSPPSACRAERERTAAAYVPRRRCCMTGLTAHRSAYSKRRGTRPVSEQPRSRHGTALVGPTAQDQRPQVVNEGAVATNGLAVVAIADRPHSHAQSSVAMPPAAEIAALTLMRKVEGLTVMPPMLTAPVGMF